MVHDLEDWEGYMIQVLKTLRSADRANWHHRMVARVGAHGYFEATQGTNLIRPLIQSTTTLPMTPCQL